MELKDYSTEELKAELKIRSDLAKAEKVGSIKLIASSNSYSDLEASLNENSMLLTYLN